MTGSPWTKPFTWTHEKIDQLIALWNKEYTGLEIAEVIGVTRGAVMGKINRLGLMGSGKGTSPLRSTKVRIRAKAVSEKRKAEVAERQAAVKQGRERRPPTTAPQGAVSSPPPIPAPRASRWTGMAAEIDVTEPWECHWPLGASYAPPTGFCKAPIEGERTSYCPYHDAMAHSPSQAKQWYESGRHQ